MNKIEVLILLSGLVTLLRAQELKDFDETILYGIDFPDRQYRLDENQNYEELEVITNNQEKYKCMIPITETKSEAEKKIDMSKSPLQYLSMMYSKQSCSYRVEAYWTYEICHGHHIRQYHEERDGKQLKSQEYYLGKWNDLKNEELKKKLESDFENGKKLKTTKIDSISYPYLEVEMTDGTICDLNNEPRTTKIRYVCYQYRKLEIYSIKETSSCNYEAIVLTTTLCMHPAFVPEETKEIGINCLPMENSPNKPLSWLYNEIDNVKYRGKVPTLSETSSPTKPVRSVAIIKFNEKGQMTIDLVENNFDQLGLLEMDFNSEKKKTDGLVNEEKTNEEKTSKALNYERKFSTSPKEKTPVMEFLSGKSCLTGGTGWWKFEFCYGKFVRQYHIDRTGETSLLLGIYDDETHINWIKNNPEKKPKAKNIRTELSHFYHDGAVCDKTGEKRQTEVKLRCQQNSPSSTSVSMYLLEPKVCQYSLVVESQIICEILQIADDDYGLVSLDKLVSSTGSGFSTANSANGETKSTETIYIGNAPLDNIEVRYQNG